MRAHPGFLLAQHLSHFDDLDEAIERFTAEIVARLEPHEKAVEWLDTIPGVSRRVADVLLAAVGHDRGRFPSARHLASWAGVCPGNRERAGKRLSGRTRPGSPWLRQALVEAAHGSVWMKTNDRGALDRWMAARRGKKKALIAVAHAILVIADQMLTHQQPYQDLGANSFDETDRQAVERRLVRRRERLGYPVERTPASDAA